MGKFRSNERTAYPTAVLDVVVAAVEDDYERVQDEDTRRWTNGPRKGRVLGVQTGAVDPDGVPELIAVKVPKDHDSVEFGVGQHALVNVELIEWSMENGRGGVSYRFASFVSPSQFDAWKGVVGTQQRAAQPA